MRSGEVVGWALGDLDRPDLIELPYEDPDLILGASALLPAAAQIRVFSAKRRSKGRQGSAPCDGSVGGVAKGGRVQIFFGDGRVQVVLAAVQCRPSCGWLGRACIDKADA